MTPEEKKLYMREWRVKNKARVKIHNARSYRKHRCQRSEQNRLWAALNPEKMCGYKRKWYQRNKDQVSAAGKLWAKNNPEAFRKMRCRIVKRRMDKSPLLRVERSLRSRVRAAINGSNKSAATLELLGCSVESLRLHLEERFVEGMSWENYGVVWHIDHIRPCASFKLSDPGQQKQCFHYSNLQPLFAADNLRKGDKYFSNK